MEGREREGKRNEMGGGVKQMKRELFYARDGCKSLNVVLHAL